MLEAKGYSVRRWCAIAAGISVLILVAATTSFIYKNGQGSASRLLMAAYGQRRTFELRMSGAPYGLPRIQRSSHQESRFDQPISLLQAEAQIAQQLRETPDAALLLQLKAKADLLNWNYRDAIKTLQHALENRPDSIDAQLDLATAYFQRAGANDQPSDYGHAIELLGAILEREPQNITALFNRAVVFEKLFLYEQASQDWRVYLSLDPNSSWTDEARQRLNIVETKLAVKGRLGDEIQVDPKVYLDAMRGTRTSDPKLGRDDDIYLDSALLLWIPNAYPYQVLAASDASPRVHDALKLLATTFETTHHDEMLAELLAHSSDRSFPLAVHKLRESIIANLDGIPETAAMAASSSAELFRQDGNFAGLLRARLELAYSEHLRLASQRCQHDALVLRSQAIARKYQWIAIQSLLEASACADTIGDPGAATNLTKQALALSRQVNYQDLHLRAMATQEWLLSDSGDIPGAWQEAYAGLEEYWAGIFPPMRAYSFYYLTGYMAETLEEWHLFYALAQEAVDSIAGTNDYELEAIARRRLAMAAAHSGHTDVASQELARSTGLFQKAPASVIKEETIVENTSELARFDTSDNLAQAHQLLNDIQKSDSAFSSRTVALDYFEASGQLAVREGRLEESRRQFMSAILIAERIATSLHTEQERLGWSEQSRNAYLGLARTNLAQHRIDAALAIWERHRTVPFLRQTVVQSGGKEHISSERLDSSTSLSSHAEDLPSLAFPSSQVVLSYAQFLDGIQIWTIDHSGISGAWVSVPAQEVYRVSRLFLRECSDPTSSMSALERDGRQLYRWLIAPVEGHLRSSSTLVVEPDGPFEDVPFSALISSTGKYLGEDRSIVLSMDTFSHHYPVLTTSITRNSPVLIVGAPSVSQGDIPQIMDAESEALNISEQFRSALLLTGARATADSITHSLRNAQVFHFAGHARIAHGSLTLLLSGSGDSDNAKTHSFIDGDDLNRSQLHNCALAVLSACSTARQDDEMPINRRGLVSSFLYLGVPHVVASEWDVDSETTSRLMTTFYRDLLAGMTVADALQKVNLEIHGTRATAHPYYWAAFQVFGKP